MSRVSAVVTYQDLKVFFQGDRNDDPKDPDYWKSKIDGETFSADSKAVSFKAEPKSIQYKVSIQAKEDSSDSDTGLTDKPAKFIADFLSTGGAGDEFFNKRSSSPDEVSGTLRWLSDGILSNKIGPVKTAKVLRRVIAESQKRELPNQDSYDVQMENIEKLKTEFEDKGWEVSTEKGANGLPKLRVEIGDEYEASVTVDSIKWTTSITLRTKSGETLEPDSIVTEDPISSYKSLRRSDAAKEFFVGHGDTRRTPGSEDTELPPDQETTPAKKKHEGNPDDITPTVAPKKNR